MEITVESIKDQIPYYLTQDQKVGLVEELKKFPANMKYYLFDRYETEVLQGDVWTHLQLFNFQTGEKAAVNGIIFSNTCDVSPDNQRAVPPNIVFAPIIPLSLYVDILRRRKISGESIASTVAAIKLQHVTNIFYMPPCGNSDENIILLDDIHSMPAPTFQMQPNKQKISALSQGGFYLFLIKLSIHFCRFHEGLARA